MEANPEPPNPSLQTIVDPPLHKLLLSKPLISEISL
jgi:hypothetical protein